MLSSFIILSCGYGVSLDCPNVVNFGKHLNLDLSQPAIWNQLQIDCCTASGLTCSSNFVTGISWSGRNLNGSFNGTALGLLSSLSNLDLSNNQIVGHINATVFPPSLNSLQLRYNLFFGQIPLYLPNGITYVNFRSTQLSGLISIPFPSSVHTLDLSYNQFVGAFPSPLPSALVNIHVNNNLFSGQLSNIPSSVTGLFIHVNQFSGTIALTKPISVNIRDNQITDIVIIDITSLSSCTLSNNALFGNLYIANLTICVQTGLFNATPIQITKTTSDFETRLLNATSIQITKTTINFDSRTATSSFPITPISTTLIKNSSTMFTTTLLLFLNNTSEAKTYLREASNFY